MQPNMLARKFYMCTFFKPIVPLFTRIICGAIAVKPKFKKLQVAFHDAFRIPRWTSASQMFVTSNFPTFYALLRNYVCKFMCCSNESKISIAIVLTVTVLWYTQSMRQAFRNLRTSICIFCQ